MPGFLGGGGSGSSGTGGEIRFPKEFIDPVTKLRISQPENLIDTDFEYGLQPTKWETVELINNTPSFFSKSGDTTIPGIASISTNNGTREITVTTFTDHGLAVGIPINVTGTKSVTADGSYIINSIPNTLTFTYLCKDIQTGNNAIEDLYTSIITGEFFQGSQIRIADAEGIITDGEATSTLTVKTDSTHGFGLNTPFYFLNLNSTISQEFEASNTAAKSFDSSNSATAQTFDGSNTLSTFNIDWSNSATVGGTTSTISGVSTVNDTITVSHGAETFANQPLGTPLYYNLTVPASSGYFFNNPRGVVFLKTTNALNNPIGTSIFQVSATPDGDVIDIVSSMSGTFQLANQARTFAGNNTNPDTQKNITIIKDSPKNFDGANEYANSLATVTGYSGSLISATGDALDYYQGAMVLYSTTGSAASGLVNNTTYFIDQFFPTGGSFNFTIKALPNSAGVLSASGGTGVQTFKKIGISIDKDVIHIKDANFAVGDLVRYSAPAAGAFSTVNAAEEKNYYFVATKYDTHNYLLNANAFAAVAATGGTVTTQSISGVSNTVHTFNYTGADQTLTVSSTGTNGLVTMKVWGAAGGSASSYVGAYGGAGGYGTATVNITGMSTLRVVVGQGGTINTNGTNQVIYGHIGTHPSGLNGGWGVNCANGGGLSGVFNSSITQANALLVGGGGGGSGQVTPGPPLGNSGPGGGANQSGLDGYNSGSGGAYGRGGTVSAGGATGRSFYANPNGRGPGNNSEPGRALIGGRADNASGAWNEGGGGGSGYFGGGPGAHGADGGYWQAAGGGSGYANPTYCTNIVGATHVLGQGGPAAAAQADIHWSAGIGTSNAIGNVGGNGKVVIMYPNEG
jgi:hypothetical protein